MKTHALQQRRTELRADLQANAERLRRERAIVAVKAVLASAARAAEIVTRKQKQRALTG